MNHAPNTMISSAAIAELWKNIPTKRGGYDQTGIGADLMKPYWRFQ